MILFYESNTNKRYPGAYILLNSKLFQAYILSINALKNSIKKYNSVELKLEYITIDFEEGLYIKL